MSNYVIVSKHGDKNYTVSFNRGNISAVVGLYSNESKDTYEIEEHIRAFLDKDELPSDA